MMDWTRKHKDWEASDKLHWYSWTKSFFFFQIKLKDDKKVSKIYAFHALAPVS